MDVGGRFQPVSAGRASEYAGGIAVVVESLKILISVPGLIFLLLIAGAFLVSMTTSHTRAGKIMVGLALFLFIALGNGLGAYRILETLEKQYPILPASSLQAGKNLSLCPSCSTVDQKKEQGSN